MQPQHEATLTQPLQCDLQRLSCKPQSHLHCGNDPTVAKQNGIPSATHPPATLAIPFTLRDRSYTVANQNGIPSATHPPAPLATPFTMRERSYSCKSQWNSVDRTCTKNSWNPFTMRNRSEHDPNMIRTWSDHTRDRLATVAPQR